MFRFLVYILSFFLANVLQAGKKYVSPAGNNANVGSFELPYLTIQFGLDHLTSNDSLFIRSAPTTKN